MRVSERLKAFAERNSITQYRMAKDLGVKHNLILNLFSGRNEPSVVTLEKVLVTYRKLDAHWLITGEGVMDKKDDGVEGGAVLESADKS